MKKQNRFLRSFFDKEEKNNLLKSSGPIDSKDLTMK